MTACGRIGFDTGAGAHSELRLDRFDAGEVLIDFPLMLALGPTRVDVDVVAPDASDLRVYDASGTVLPVEIEQPSSPIIAWVRVPRIEGTTTTLTLSYGDPTAPAAVGSTWAPSYEGVWHFGTDTLLDSTGKHTATATGTTAAAGFRGGGLGFDAVAQTFVTIPDAASLDFPTLTLSAMLQPASSSDLYSGVISRELDDTVDEDLYLGTYNGNLFAEVYGVEIDTGTTARPAAVDDWHAFALTYDGSMFRAYEDGVEFVTLPDPGPPTHPADPFMFGANRNDRDVTERRDLGDDDFFDGVADEIRFDHAVRSPAWIAADAASLGDAWITYGPIER